MKINLSIFKDEDTKDAVIYQSWHWDIMVYHQAGAEITPSSSMSSAPYRAIHGSW